MSGLLEAKRWLRIEAGIYEQMASMMRRKRRGQWEAPKKKRKARQEKAKRRNHQEINQINGSSSEKAKREK